MKIEVEVRSFVSEEQFKQLLEFMKKNAKPAGEDNQVSYYFSGPADLRIQKCDDYAKLWLKKGKIHDRHREEFEVKFAREDFDNLEKLLEALGYEVEIKWFRDRKRFQWDGTKVTLDITRGYGFIIELEKLTDSGDEDKIHSELEDKMKELGVEVTPRKVFDTRFEQYKKNWRSLTE